MLGKSIGLKLPGRLILPGADRAERGTHQLAAGGLER
jgi:hypothetical protein